MSTIKAHKNRTSVTHPELEPSHPPSPAEPFAEKVREILAALGEDPGREGLVKTPERVESSLRWLTQGYRMWVEDAVGDAVFEESHQSMIMVRDIELYSMCEHHLLPFFAQASRAHTMAWRASDATR
jgi:GTP cyclohydrolase I